MSDNGTGRMHSGNNKDKTSGYRRVHVIGDLTVRYRYDVSQVIQVTLTHHTVRLQYTKYSFGLFIVD